PSRWPKSHSGHLRSVNFSLSSHVAIRTIHAALVAQLWAYGTSHCCCPALRYRLDPNRTLNNAIFFLDTGGFQIVVGHVTRKISGEYSAWMNCKSANALFFSS